MLHYPDHVSQTVRSNLESESYYLLPEILVVPIFFRGETSSYVASKVLRELWPWSLHGFNPHGQTPAYWLSPCSTTPLAHSTSAHDTPPPDASVARSHVASSQSANVILSIRPLVTVCLKPQVPCALPAHSVPSAYSNRCYLEPRRCWHPAHLLGDAGRLLSSVCVGTAEGRG